jgi:hypothetical protein
MAAISRSVSNPQSTLRGMKPISRIRFTTVSSSHPLLAVGEAGKSSTGLFHIVREFYDIPWR